MISVSILTKGSKWLDNCLESFRKSKMQDFEIILLDSSQNYVSSEIAKEYDVKIFRSDTDLKALKARYLAHKETRGEYELIFDETREIKNNLMEVLSNLEKTQIIAIGEDERVDSYWGRLASLDKRRNLLLTSLDPQTNAYVLPRFFKRDLLEEAFKNIQSKLTTSEFNGISYGEHHIIYYETFKLQPFVHLLKDTYIQHNGDIDFISILRKYHWYGVSTKQANQTCYSSLFRVSNHRRPIVDLKERMKLLPLFFARGLPYLIGLYLF